MSDAPYQRRAALLLLGMRPPPLPRTVRPSRPAVTHGERGSAAVALLGLVGAVATVATTVLGVAPTLGSWSFADAAATSRLASLEEPTRGPAPVGISHDPATGTPTSIGLSVDRGAGGTGVVVTGEGFVPGERVALRFDADELGRATADREGRLGDVPVQVPTDRQAFAPASFTVTATGAASGRSADATFRLTG